MAYDRVLAGSLKHLRLTYQAIAAKKDVYGCTSCLVGQMMLRCPVGCIYYCKPNSDLMPGSQFYLKP